MKYLKNPFAITLLSTMLLVPCVTLAKVYKVVDENGRITFTDQPPIAVPEETRDTTQSADTIETKIESNTTPSTTEATPPETGDAATEEPPLETGTAPEPAKSTNGYESIVIASPEDQSIIPDEQDNVLIHLNIAPSLQEDHFIQLYYDNRKFGDPSKLNTFQVTKLFRGAHNISADIVDNNGNTLLSSPTITIFVKHTSN